MRPRISIRGLVRPSILWSVRPLVRRSVTLSSKSMKNGLLWILSDWDSAGRGRKRNKEEGGTRRKEGRGGRSDEEEGATRRVKKRKSCKEMKNEKVAWGRIVDLRVLFLSFSVAFCLVFFFLTCPTRDVCHSEVRDVLPRSLSNVYCMYGYCSMRIFLPLYYLSAYSCI